MSTLATLKTYFETGDVPTQAQFADLIDSIRGTGWASYRDTQYTEVSPFTVPNNGITYSLPNNAGTKIDAYLPFGVTSFYNGTIITPENIGDYYTFTIRFKAKDDQEQGGYFNFGIDIGGTQGIIFNESLIFAKGANIETSFSIDTPGFSLTTFVANGGVVKITSGSGNISIYDIEYQIIREHKSL
jgi:hypothetical protein